MYRAKRYIISSLIIILLTFHLSAQDITGTWEGDMGDDQFLQLNIIQNSDKLCGYSWDSVKTKEKNYCKAYFKAHYDKGQRAWKFKGTSFIETTSKHIKRDSLDFFGDSIHIDEYYSHSLMWLHLASYRIGGEDILKGFFIEDPSLLTSFSDYTQDSGYINEHTVFLKRVAPRPQQVLGKMQDCFLEEQQSKDTLTNPITIVKPAESIADTIPPTTAIKDSITIPKQLVKRKNSEQSHLEVNVKTITLNVYDNAVVDGDTISVFYNGKLLLSHQRLSEKPIVINLTLDEKQTRHELVLFAENLGSIPPNTALIVIYAGDKRYELFSSASLEENAVLVFDYKPK